MASIVYPERIRCILWISSESRSVDSLRASSQRGSYNSCFSHRPRNRTADGPLFQDEKSANGTSTRRADLVSKNRGMLSSFQHQCTGTSHRLRRHDLCLRPRQTHGNSTIRDGFHDQRHERGRRATDSSARIHRAGRQVHDTADAVEDPRYERLLRLLERRDRLANDRHALADEGSRVGHGANDTTDRLAIGSFDLGFQSLGCRTGQDRDEQLAPQRIVHALGTQDIPDHLRLAAKQDDVGRLDSGDVVIDEDLEGLRVGRERGTDPLGRGGTTDAGVETSRELFGKIFGGSGDTGWNSASSDGSRGGILLELSKSGHDAGENGDTHSTATEDGHGKTIIEISIRHDG